MSRILLDTAQRPARAHIPGFRKILTAPSRPFEHKFRFYQPEVKEPREVERVAEAIEEVAVQRSVDAAALRLAGRPVHRPRASKRNRTGFYVPKEGHQNGPLFAFEDRATGYVLARCRGTLHHVVAEAQKFALSQGLTVADLHLRIIADE